MTDNKQITWGLIIGLALSIGAIWHLSILDKTIPSILSGIAGGCALGLGAVMIPGGAGGMGEIFRRVLTSHEEGKQSATVSVAKENPKEDENA